MKALKLLSLIVALVIAAVSFTGCEEDDGKGFVFGYDISANPDSLDPQCAKNEQSYFVIGCIFEGLVKTDSAGNIKAAGAVSWSVSDNGLKYIFSLDRQARWTDVNDFEAKCTAKDYVYGFTRLFLPETRSEKAKDFFCIKNAEEINSGKITDTTLLGVYAEDEYKLVIELAYPKSDFLLLLTTPPAMPCNEKYFLNAQGKYGLTAKTTPSNSAFYVKTWNYDYWSHGSEHNNMVLRYSDLYDSRHEIYPLGLNFFIEDDGEFEPDFFNGDSQNIRLSGSAAQRMMKKGYSYTEHGVEMCGLIANTKSSIFKNESLGMSLMYSADTSAMKLPFGCNEIFSAVPKSVSLSGINYRENVNCDRFIKSDDTKAKALYNKAVEGIKRDELHEVKIIAMQNRDEEIGEAAKELIQQWQAKLDFYCSLVFLPENEYNAALKNGDYSLAIIRYTGEYNSPISYLNYFTEAGFSYSCMDDDYAELIRKAATSVKPEQCYDYCLKAERQLMTSGSFIPLCVSSEFFFSAENCYDIEYNPFSKTIDYTKAICIE